MGRRSSVGTDLLKGRRFPSAGILQNRSPTVSLPASPSLRVCKQLRKQHNFAVPWSVPMTMTTCNALNRSGSNDHIRCPHVWGIQTHTHVGDIDLHACPLELEAKGASERWDDTCQLTALNSGKPFKEARGDIYQNCCVPFERKGSNTANCTRKFLFGPCLEQSLTSTQPLAMRVAFSARRRGWPVSRSCLHCLWKGLNVMDHLRTRIWPPIHMSIYKPLSNMTQQLRRKVILGKGSRRNPCTDLPSASSTCFGVPFLQNSSDVSQKVEPQDWHVFESPPYERPQNVGWITEHPIRMIPYICTPEIPNVSWFFTPRNCRSSGIHKLAGHLRAHWIGVLNCVPPRHVQRAKA